MLRRYFYLTDQAVFENRGTRRGSQSGDGLVVRRFDAEENTAVELGFVTRQKTDRGDFRDLRYTIHCRLIGLMSQVVSDCLPWGQIHLQRFAAIDS